MNNRLSNSPGNILIDTAIEFATKAHRNQVRKGTDIPYISHLFSVGIILTEAGCSEEVIAAGILHDTIEDTSTTVEDLLAIFGEKVTDIVEGCTEPDKSLPWEERKQRMIEFLKTAPYDVCLVSCADKLHNIRSIAGEYARIGDEVWARFKQGKKEQEWFYRRIVQSLCNRTGENENTTLFTQLRNEVDSLFGSGEQK